MVSWTPDNSTVLSMLLDEVVGTKEMIETRQDYCRIHDSLKLHWFKEGDGVYFTGSKSEGLDLPGSDEDYMFDINGRYNTEVIQSLDEKPDISPNIIFLMCCENVPPGFALLQKVHPIPICPVHGTSQLSSCRIFLKSGLHIDYHLSVILSSANNDHVKAAKRQGPSVEIWLDHEDLSGPGSDQVMSVRCKFWPNQALDWIQRQRHFGWPSSNEISSITDFGFHLVSVGHPHSIKGLHEHEWRISFSIAERILVWSFNHVQMQCYALMKIILKEFIKMKCNPQNQVLCSYFIKTFLFWKYETTELNFWRADNLRECLRYLLVGFSACIREGMLRHYFIPRFNLLSVKLTRAALTELLQLFDIIVQSDISIIKECKTLTKIWSEFLKEKDNKDTVISRLRKTSLLRNDECMMKFIIKLFSDHDVIDNSHSLSEAIQFGQRLALSKKSPLQTLALTKLFSEMHINFLRHLPQSSGNKGVYQLHRTVQTDTGSFDISTCKLWCAILLSTRGHFLSVLNIINQVLSSIPPFAMHHCDCKGTINASNESKQLYMAMFQDSDTTITHRARKAWTLKLHICKDTADLVPWAIQIELYFDIYENCIWLSQFAIAYYLQFLCYHGLGQYLNIDRALQQLLDTLVYNTVQCSCIYNSLNIIGHCLLLTGRKYQAREVFLKSNSITDQYNSAPWYLQNFF